VSISTDHRHALASLAGIGSAEDHMSEDAASKQVTHDVKVAVAINVY
jgi:hypothetical protein